MPRIEELYAFVAENADGEGITAHFDPQQGWLPMIVSRREVVDALREVAQDMATRDGLRIKLVRFSVRTELETIEPQPASRGMVQ